MKIIYALMFEDDTSSLAPYHCSIFLHQYLWFWLHMPLHSCPGMDSSYFFHACSLFSTDLHSLYRAAPWLKSFSLLTFSNCKEFSVTSEGQFPKCYILFINLDPKIPNDFLNWSWSNDRRFVTWWRDMCNNNLFSSNVVLQSVNILPPKEGGQMHQE